MTLQVNINLLQDNNGVPGESIPQDRIEVNNSFFIEIEVGDIRENSTGVIGLALDLKWNAEFLEALDSNPADILTANFPFSPRGTIDNSEGIITDLGAGSLPNAGIGRAIGVGSLERFALLHFQSELITENSIPLAVTIDSRNLALVDSSTFDGLINIDFQTLEVISENTNLKLNNPLEDIVVSEDISFSFVIPQNTFNISEENRLTYSATLEDGSELPSWLTFDLATRTFSGTPTNDDVGDLAVKIMAIDSEGISGSDDFILTIENVDDPPFVINAIFDVFIDEDAEDTVIDISSVFGDIDSDEIEIAVTGNSNNSLVNAYLDRHNIVLDYQDNQFGSAEITLKATADGQTVSNTFTVNVDPIDDSPFLSNPLEDITVDEDAADTIIDLSNVFEDIDSEEIEIAVTGNSNNSLVNAYLDRNNIVLDYQDNQFGNAEITLRATADGQTVSDTFTVNVDPIDDSPFLSNPLEDITVDEDAEDTIIDLSNVFEDIDSEEIEIIVIGNNNNSLVNAYLDDSDLILDYQNNQSGMAEITLLGTTNNHIALDNFLVNVNPSNNLPVVSLTLESESNRLIEGDKITIDFAVAGEIPEAGLFILLEGDLANISDDLELFNDSGDLAVETNNIGELSEANIIDRKVLIPLTDSNASISFPVKNDDINEGLEEYNFSLVDSTLYDIDRDRKEISFSINDSQIVGTVEQDILEIDNSNNTFTASDSDDLIDLSIAGSENYVYGGDGNDTIILGSSDFIFGDGDDSVFAASGEII